jgi:hypothetical protein
VIGSKNKVARCKAWLQETKIIFAPRLLGPPGARRTRRGRQGSVAAVFDHARAAGFERVYGLPPKIRVARSNEWLQMSGSMFQFCCWVLLAAKPRVEVRDIMGRSCFLVRDFVLAHYFSRALRATSSHARPTPHAYTIVCTIYRLFPCAAPSNALNPRSKSR